jgi:hypothetical protein
MKVVSTLRKLILKRVYEVRDKIECASSEFNKGHDFYKILDLEVSLSVLSTGHSPLANTVIQKSMLLSFLLIKFHSALKSRKWVSKQIICKSTHKSEFHIFITVYSS